MENEETTGTGEETPNRQFPTNGDGDASLSGNRKSPLGIKKSNWETVGLHHTRIGPPNEYDPVNGADEWKGRGWEKGKEIRVKLPVTKTAPGPSKVEDYGEPITRDAATQMVVAGKWATLRNEIQAAVQDPSKGEEEIQRLLKTPVAVSFSQEVLLFLLSQPGCAGVKFYFCTNHDAVPSLVLVGVDRDNNDLGTVTGSIAMDAPSQKVDNALSGPREERTAIFEVGGPKTVGDYLQYFNSNKSNLHEPQYAFVKAIGEYFS